VTAAQAISYAIQLSVALSMFCVALQATPQSLRWLLGRPGLLARTLAAMFAVMPLLAVALAAGFDLHRSLEIALITVAISPVPPVLPKKQLAAGGTSSYAVGLVAVTAVVAVVFIPVAIQVFGWALGRSFDVPVGLLIKIVATSLLLPLVAGMAIRKAAPEWAERIAGKIALGAGILLLVALVPLLIAARHALLAQVGDFTLAAIAVFVAAGLATGHLLGGPDEGDRTVLALATATRHPAVALAVAQAAAPDEKTVPAAMILYILTGAILSIPYVKWRSRRSAAH